jgi:FIMAH domain
MRIMKSILLLFFSTLLVGQVDNDLESFRDTMFYDQSSGNYIIEYLGNSSIGELDTIVTMTFEPGNKIEPVINSKVSFKNDSSYYLYEYNISNGPNALQRLVYFSLFFNEDIKIKNKQTNTYHGGWYVDYLKKIGWWGDGGLEPTWSVDGFAISSKNLPGIGLAGMKGRTNMLNYEHGFPSNDIEKKIHSLSVGKSSFNLIPTVVPIKLPEHLTVVEFVDTIKANNDSSFVFGWIEDIQTRDKYNAHFSNASNFLEQGDSSSARSELQIVLNECNLDSSKTLTSEAYALLKFNTEYLLEQLPEINIADMFVSLILNIKQCYEKEWIDNTGIYNSLIIKAENAHKSYEKGNTKTSINHLNSFLNELEAQNGKHLTSEAYTLLKNNAEYLMAKLEE